MAWKDYVFGSKECIKFLLNKYEFETIMDLGCGYGPYIDMMKAHNKKFSSVDVMPTEIFKKYENDPSINLTNDNFMTHDFGDVQYDCVFSCHVVEHVADTQTFIELKKSLVKDGGVFCIMWPKPKNAIVGGHVHVFTPGLMLYNLIRTGMDCSTWDVLDCDYTYAVMGKYTPVKVDLTYGSGEIENLSKYFPFNAKQAFDGVRIPCLKKIKPENGYKYER